MLASPLDTGPITWKGRGRGGEEEEKEKGGKEGGKYCDSRHLNLFLTTFLFRAPPHSLHLSDTYKVILQRQGEARARAVRDVQVPKVVVFTRTNTQRIQCP